MSRTKTDVLSANRELTEKGRRLARMVKTSTDGNHGIALGLSVVAAAVKAAREVKR